MEQPKVEESTEIKPGELIELGCPIGSKTTLQIGQYLPETDSQFVVVEIKNEKIFLGPLKGGSITAQIPCADGTIVTKEYLLKPLTKEELPDHVPPLLPESLAYPFWLWLVIFAFIAIFLWALRVAYQRLTKKWIRPKIQSSAASTKSPGELLKEYIRQAKKSVVLQTADPNVDDRVIREFYSQGYSRLRAFLEERLRLAVFHESSKEFIGTLKASSSDIALSPALLQNIESLLSQSDQVKFAHLNPPVEDRKQFIRQLEEVNNALNRGPS